MSGFIQKYVNFSEKPLKTPKIQFFNLLKTHKKHVFFTVIFIFLKKVSKSVFFNQIISGAPCFLRPKMDPFLFFCQKVVKKRLKSDHFLCIFCLFLSKNNPTIGKTPCF
jgi:hypothetical protein